MLIYSSVKEMAVNNNNNEGTIHYTNRIYFLSNDDFDYMVAAKHAAEEAIGWKVLPENIVYRVEKNESYPDQVGITVYHPLT